MIPYGFYEIRIDYQSNIYRGFYCFDQGQLIVLFNEFQKETPAGTCF
jgi:phage-related protein